MSCPVNLQALPCGVLEAVFTAENVRGRSSMNSLTPLSFPKSRSALWDGSPAGEKLRLQLCSHRKPRLVLLEKALRLAQRHARHSNKPLVHCFFLGSVSVDADEEGVTVTLDRFDPGRDQAGASGRVPSAPLPGDVLVPCLFSTQAETSSDAVVQSEAELHHCFKVLQQIVSSRQTLDLSQLMKVRVRVVCSQQSDAAAYSLSWTSVCPSVGVDVQPVRAVPVIPTALLRSLTSINRPPPLATNRQRGFLTMDQTRKLLLLLESDPKASSLPLVGLWLSGVTHVYNPQVWAWCLRFLFSSALQDRVFSESGRFLLVLFSSTHRAPQFFQCQGPGPQPDYRLLTASQHVTLYQVLSVEGQTLRCELGSEDHSRQMEIFREAQSSFNSAAPAAAGLSASDQDSGVEDEDLSPRPSPSPHPPAQQPSLSKLDRNDFSASEFPASARRVQPSVPELSLLIDSSFSSNQEGSTHRPPAADRKSAPPTGNSPSVPRRPAPAADKTSAPPTGNATTSSSSSVPRPPAPPHLHSTPNSNVQQPCTCCTTHTSNCTSIFSSPGLHPAAAPPPASSSHHHSPHPPSSIHPAPSPCPPAHPYLDTPHPPSSLHPVPPPPPSAHSHYHTPPSSNHTTSPSVPPSSTHAAPLSSHHHTPPPFYNHPPAPSAPPPSYSPSSPFSNHTPPPSTRLSGPPPSSPLLPSPPCACSHPPSVLWCGDSPSPHPSHPAVAADPAPPPWFPRPSCVSHCCDQVGTVLPTDTYQLLLHQDRQLRLLQAQVQMLLEAQGKLQSSGQQVNTETPKSTASIAVGTGASLFWGDPVQPIVQHEVQAPPPSSPTPPPSSSPSPRRPPSHADLSVSRPLGGAEDGDFTGQEAAVSPCDQHSGLQSPVLGESASMYRPADDQQSFIHDLMNQLTSRLQESDSRQEVEEEESRRSSLSVVSDRSQSSQSSQSSSLSRRKPQRCGDPVVSATLQQLQLLGADVTEEDLTESDRRIHQTVESSSTLASINPAAVLSRLSVSEPTVSALFPGSSVDLSLEANAIALRYLSDSQLSRLSLGGHAPLQDHTSSRDSMLSPSNMSLATRKYMRRYGLIEEEDEEEAEQEVDVREALSCQPLNEAQNVKLLPQSQLIRDLRPKMQLLAGGAKPNTADKENCASRRPSLARVSNRQTEGSVGNILDLSRLRQLPKLF